MKIYLSIYCHKAWETKNVREEIAWYWDSKLQTWKTWKKLKLVAKDRDQWTILWRPFISARETRAHSSWVVVVVNILIFHGLKSIFIEIQILFHSKLWLSRGDIKLWQKLLWSPYIMQYNQVLMKSWKYICLYIVKLRGRAKMSGKRLLDIEIESCRLGRLGSNCKWLQKIVINGEFCGGPIFLHEK